MIHEETDRPRPRPEPRLSRSILTFDLDKEVESLRSEPGWSARGHNARTLVKRPDAKVVLALFAKGQRVKEHAVDSSVTIQTLSGRVRLHAGDEPVELRAGGLLAMEPGTPHDVEALEESALLIVI